MQRKPLLNSKAGQKGFTLIELMVTLAVMGILLVVGVPSFIDWIRDSRMDNASRSLAGVLKHARSEAVSRQNVITIGAGNTTNKGDWANGAYIYTDEAAGGNTDYSAADDTLIKNFDLNMTGITVTSSDNDNFISFNTNGRLINEDNIIGATVQSFDLCDDGGDPDGSRISINAVGRVSIQTRQCP